MNKYAPDTVTLHFTVRDTGIGIPPGGARYLAAGMTEHVPKPIDFKLLQDVIARATKK